MSSELTLLLTGVASGVARLVLSVIFATACLHKLRARDRFVAVLRAYRVLPDGWTRVAAGLLAVAEGAVAVSLWMPWIAEAAAGAGLLLLTGYAGAIALNLYRGRRHIDCGCGFGAVGQPISPALLLRNAVLISLCLGLVSAPRQMGWPGAMEGVLVVAVACVILLCHRTVETLLANAPALARLEVGGR